MVNEWDIIRKIQENEKVKKALDAIIKEYSPIEYIIWLNKFARDILRDLSDFFYTKKEKIEMVYNEITGEFMEILKRVEKPKEEILRFSKYLINSPPEFSKDTDPKIVQTYLSIKGRIEEALVKVVFKFFEKYGVEKVIVADLIGGSPAWDTGVITGRDIDIFVYTKGKVDNSIKQNIETILDYVVGQTISELLKEFLQKIEDKDVKRCVEKCQRPFNEIIKHNLVEIHVNEELPGKYWKVYKREDIGNV